MDTTLVLKKSRYLSKEAMLQHIEEWLQTNPWIYEDRKKQLLSDAKNQLENFITKSNRIPFLVEAVVELRGHHVSMS